MKLYIRIVDGQPFEHPILEDNFRQAFPFIDVDNLPPEFARFERVPRPPADDGYYIVEETCTYQWVDGIVKDVWQLTQEKVPDEPTEVPSDDSGI